MYAPSRCDIAEEFYLSLLRDFPKNEINIEQFKRELFERELIRASIHTYKDVVDIIVPPIRDTNYTYEILCDVASKHYPKNIEGVRASSLPKTIEDSDVVLNMYDVTHEVLIYPSDSDGVFTLPGSTDVFDFIGTEPYFIPIKTIIPFSIINTSDKSNVTINPGDGGKSIGNMMVLPGVSGLFRIQITHESAYNVYRIA